MHHLRWRFGRFGGLYWRLTASYVLVTLLAALTLDVALTVVPVVRRYQQAQNVAARREPIFVQIQQLESPRIAPYLEQPVPDRAALRNWVLLPLLRGRDLPAKAAIASAAVVVRTASQTIVLAACATPAIPAGAPTTCADDAVSQAQTALAGTPAQTAIQSALAGDPHAADHTYATPGGQSVVALPVTAYDGRLLGVLVLVANAYISDKGATPNALPPLADLVAQFIANLQSDAFYFILLATVIGTLVGILITRNLTRRLRRITRAADAWSQGDFSASAHDASGDELGQLARDLDAMAIQLQQLVTTRQQLAVAEERNRLARDLHDSVKQQVFAGALLVGAARAQLSAGDGNETVRMYLAEAEGLAERTRRELTDLIRELRPARQDVRGLAVTLREEAGEWSRRAGIVVDLQLDAERFTPPDIAEALTRVTQEALANIARHSGAQHVTMRLAWDDDAIHLSVADDGHGFDVARATGSAGAGGVGLASMRERVDALGGKLRLASAPGATVVEATIPLRDARAGAAVETAETVENTQEART